MGHEGPYRYCDRVDKSFFRLTDDTRSTVYDFTLEWFYWRSQTGVQRISNGVLLVLYMNNSLSSISMLTMSGLIPPTNSTNNSSTHRPSLYKFRLSTNSFVIIYSNITVLPASSFPNLVPDLIQYTRHIFTFKHSRSEK